MSCVDNDVRNSWVGFANVQEHRLVGKLCCTPERDVVQIAYFMRMTLLTSTKSKSMGLSLPPIPRFMCGNGCVCCYIGFDVVCVFLKGISNVVVFNMIVFGFFPC